MKKVNLLLLVFCFLTIVVCFDSCFADDYAYNLREYYPLGSTDSWNYILSKGDSELKVTVKVNGTFSEAGVSSVMLNINGVSDDYMFIDSQGIKQVKLAMPAGEAKWSPARIVYPYLKLQEKKNYEFQRIFFHNERKKDYIDDNSYEVSLDSVSDSVDVPAGSFSNCLKYSSVFKSKPVGTLEDKQILICTTWFASGVGVVKTNCSTTDRYQDPPVENVSVMLQLESANINGVKIGK